jgi:hypothetical protein
MFRRAKSFLFLLPGFFGLFALALPAELQNNSVHLRFFHVECRECDIVADMLEVLTNDYYPRLIVHDYDFMVRSNYMLMVRLERSLKIKANEPVAIYVGSNALYGLTPIRKNVVRLITNGLSRGCVSLWLPPDPRITVSSTTSLYTSHISPTGVIATTGRPADDDPVESRFSSFSLGVIIGAGLLDGINPCAFATLILFVSLLSCYRTSKTDILLTSLVFSFAVFLTYMLLGLGFLTALKQLMLFRLVAVILQWALVGLCVLFALLSLRDALRVRQDCLTHDLALALPESWRLRIAKLLGTYVGRRHWLLGVFGVGIVVSLLESICTGQVYLPTLVYMTRVADHRIAALAYLSVYNVMFIVPIIFLALIVMAGVTSQSLLAWQSRNAVTTRVIMACVFAGLAVLLALN